MYQIVPTNENPVHSIVYRVGAGVVEGLEQWCLYVLTGISTELKKVDKLSNLHFLNSKVLYPALEYSKGRGQINQTESKIFKRTINQGMVKASDLKEVLPTLKSAQLTYQIDKLIDRGLLQPVSSHYHSAPPNQPKVSVKSAPYVAN